MDISSIFPEWLLTTLIVLSIFYFFFVGIGSKKNSSAAAVKLPPGPPKLPFIGNLHQILGKPRHEALWQLSKEYGPLMKIHIGSKLFLIVSSPAVAKQILKTQDHVFCSRERFQATKRLTYDFSDIAFSPHSGHWREMRKLLVSEFMGPKRAKLSNYVLVTETENVIRSLSMHPSNTEVNLNKMFLEIVKKMVCKVAFGTKYREQPLKGPSWDAMLYEAMELLNGSVGDSFPWLGYVIDQLTGWNARLNNGFNNLNAYIDTIIDDHLISHKNEEIITDDDDKDFVHTLLESSSKETASGYRLTNSDIKALVMDVLTGGIDTTVVTLVWAMSEIVRNTRVMQKLQSEIRNCTIQNAGEVDTTRMPYLKMVVKETLRMHAPAPLLIPHVSLSHTQVNGYDVFPDTVVVINAWGIGRDPSTWGENATEFYPERFENIDGDFGRDRFEMLPFGGGRRSCPAMNSAPANVEFVIANLLYWFDWEVPSGMKNEDLDMEDDGTLVLGKKVPLCLVPTYKA